jgi:FKBP-type peptidyl-prolyl cis-trans isomerase
MRKTLIRTITTLSALGLAAMPHLASAHEDASHGKAGVDLIKIDHKVGEGTEAVAGKVVTVHYTGWLYDANAPENKGQKFDSSRDRHDPFGFPLGGGRVIRGWDEGVAGMKIGGQRTLIIPPNMGYGARGAGGVIPPNATLVFDVELLEVR